MEYKRPEKLRLLTEEEINALYQADVEEERKYNEEHDPDYNLDRFTRKWKKHKIIDASSWWEALRTINKARFYEIVYWLSVTDEPCNPWGGRPSNTKSLARDIKYVMTPRQRAVAYKIITERYNKNY